MHLIVPLDESERSLLAVPVARLLAQDRDDEITLVTVVPGPAMPGKTRELAEFLHTVAVEEREVSALTVHSTVRVGDPASEILQLAWETEADLIVMSTHARRGPERALLGSVADQVLQSAGIPVVLLHADGRAIERIETIVVALDGTPEAAAALTSALPLAQSSNAKVALVQAADQHAQQAAETYVEGVAAQLRGRGVQAVGRCTGGKPAVAILSAAEEVDADLIVMSTHARGGVVRSVLGSVADQVVRQSHRPVLLVRRHVVAPPAPNWWVIEPRTEKGWIGCMLPVERLFETTAIGTMPLRNRIVMPPMVTNFASADGEVTQRLIDYFVARARGGVGLIIVEASYIRHDGKGFPCEVGIDRDELIPGLRRLVDAVHLAGAKIAIQLFHGGRQTHSQVTGQPIVAPSAIPDPVSAEMPRPLTVAEIKDLERAFAEAARRAKEARFDAVEIHGAHGYLIAAFLSPYANRRMDEYGGGIRDRARFALEVLQQVREAVGPDYPILFRLSGEEPVEGALTLQQTRVIARLIEQAGANAIDVSVGNYPSMVQIIPGQDVSRGSEVRLAAGIKQTVRIPVITVGRLDDPLLAEQVLMDGSADLVAIGRGLLADPEWPNKVKSGQFDAITPCMACNQGCIGQLLAGCPISCVLNPAAGREAEFQPRPATTSQHVVVVGGGPGGLEAARILAERGHHVRLFEEDQQLGGEFAAAAMVPRKEEVATALRWMITQARDQQVEIELGRRLTAEQIVELHPDAVILATGADPVRPDLPGADDARVTFAHDVLLGCRPAGQRVLVVGGGAVGMEVAEYLAVQSKDVTVVEMTERLGWGMESSHQFWVTETLRNHGAKLLTHLQLEAIAANGRVCLRDGERNVELGPFDTIVLAVGYRPRDGLEEGLSARGIRVFRVGDAVAPRTALEAIREAADVALAI